MTEALCEKGDRNDHKGSNYDLMGERKGWQMNERERNEELFIQRGEDYFGLNRLLMMPPFLQQSHKTAEGGKGGKYISSCEKSSNYFN